MSKFLIAQAPFSHYTKDIQYRICNVSHSKLKVQKKCHLYLYLSVRTEQNKRVYSQPYWLYIGDDPEPNSLHTALMHLMHKDSAEFIIPTGMFKENFLNIPLNKIVSQKERLIIAMRVVRVVEPDIILDDTYEAFVRQYISYETKLMSNFATGAKDMKKHSSGYWQRQHVKGNGRKATKAGDVVVVAYQGRFLNGLLFDKGATKKTPFQYVRGVQWQMLGGLATLMGQMSEGEKASVVLPSKMAFGDKGLADIVPPYTPVMYDIEILEVKVKK
ncbi:MAG: FKBP-type peptidyl-prolyl cis-trans isomerase [Bacteroidales bacterium]